MPARRRLRKRLDPGSPRPWSRAPKRSYNFTPPPPSSDSDDNNSVLGLGFSPPHQRQRIPSPGEERIGGVEQNIVDGGDEFWGEHGYNQDSDDLEGDENQEEEEESQEEEEEQNFKNDLSQEEEEEEGWEDEESQEEDEEEDEEESQEEEESDEQEDHKEPDESQKLKYDLSEQDEQIVLGLNFGRTGSELDKQRGCVNDAASKSVEKNKMVSIQQLKSIAGCSNRRRSRMIPPAPTYLHGNVINEQYKVLLPVGAGSYGYVLHARDLKRRIDVALKVTKCVGPFALDEGQREMKQLVKLNELDPQDNKHIVRLLEAFELEMRFHLVFELLSISLTDAINRSMEKSARYPVPGLTFEETIAVACQLLDALDFMHAANIIHCDLKPDNIMLKNENLSRIKVIDFGCAIDAIEDGNPTPNYPIQSLQYRAPELIVGYETFTSAIDMWSLGCIVSECYTGNMLVPGCCEKSQLKLMIELMGYPQPRFLSQGSKTRAFHNYFGENLHPDPQKVPVLDGTEVPCNLVAALRKKTNDNELRDYEENGWDSNTNKSLQVLNIVYGMLQYEPARRITTANIINHRMFAAFRQGNA